MIPKVIHYCWFGKNPLPEKAKKCIDSWRKYFPDYEIIQWNEDNFDVNIIPYTKEAYSCKKYAFVSDYARLWIIYNYGGLYFDTDVEIIRSYQDIIAKGDFMGRELGSEYVDKYGVNPGLGFGAAPHNVSIKKILDIYKDLHYIYADGAKCKETIVSICDSYFSKLGLLNDDIIQKCSDFVIYPKKFFCPKDYISGEITICSDSHSIHHYDATWIDAKHKLYFFVSRKIGVKFAQRCSFILKNIYGKFKR